MDAASLKLLINRIDAVTAIVNASGGLSNKVPYTGANQAVNLGSQTLTTTGKISTGTGLSGSALVQFSSMLSTGSGRVDLGEYTAGRGTIWIDQAIPSNVNFALSDDTSGNTFINGSSGVKVSVSGGIYVGFSSTQLSLGAGQTSYNIDCSSTNGTKIGIATSQKLGFWNATPVIQQTNAIAGAAFAANTSVITDGSATYGGYTGGQIVAALKLYGILA